MYHVKLTWLLKMHISVVFIRRVKHLLFSAFDRSRKRSKKKKHWLFKWYGKSEKYHLEDQIVPYLDLMTALGLGILVSVLWALLPTQGALISKHTFSWGMSHNLPYLLFGLFCLRGIRRGLGVKTERVFLNTHTHTHILSCIILFIPHSFLCSSEAHNITCSAYYINIL